MFRSPIVSSLRTSVRSFSTTPITRSASYANASFIGRLGQDPEVQEAVSTGRKYLRLSIAVQRSKDQATEWFPVTVFNDRQIEYLTNYAKKGALLHVEATPQASVIEGEDGSKSTRFNFIQKSVSILHNPNSTFQEE